jgi:SAM-dependent methyltransferase
MSQPDSARDREHFNSIAATYTRKDLSPTAHPARQLRLLATLGPCGQPSFETALEFGCGAGFAPGYLNGNLQVKRYLGIDHSSALIGFARDNDAQQPRATEVEFRVGDVDCLGSDETFDLIFMIGVVHHLEQPVQTLQRLRHHLRDGGWLAINEPASHNPIVQGMRWLRKRMDRGYSREQTTFSSDQLEHLLQASGFSEIQVQPQGIFSTPFAEVPLPPAIVIPALSRLACACDRWLLHRWPNLCKPLAWNLVATARAS